MSKQNTLLSKDEVKHVANLAKLQLSEDEIVRFQSQLSDILNYIQQLQDIDTEHIAETSQVTGLSNIWRSDEAMTSLAQSDALSNTHKSNKGFVQVPGILESE